MQTQRLELRLINDGDADFLVRLMNTENWLQYIGDRKVYANSDALHYMNQRMSPKLSKKGFVNHVMIERVSGISVGTCSLHDREGVEGLDIGYALLSEYEGKGYATEAAKAMIRLAFEDFEQSKISAITTDENTRSCNLLEKLGFAHHGYTQLSKDSEKLRLYRLEKANWV